jgi:hypothetical protein
VDCRLAARGCVGGCRSASLGNVRRRAVPDRERRHHAEFYRAVVTCEQRTAPSALRGCGHQLTTPDAREQSIFDLWHIVTDCLAFADAAWQEHLDDMYPSEESYEDLVNDCLGR